MLKMLRRFGGGMRRIGRHFRYAPLSVVQVMCLAGCISSDEPFYGFDEGSVLLPDEAFVFHHDRTAANHVLRRDGRSYVYEFGETRGFDETRVIFTFIAIDGLRDHYLIQAYLSAETIGVPGYYFCRVDGENLYYVGFADQSFQAAADFHDVQYRTREQGRGGIAYIMESADDLILIYRTIVDQGDVEEHLFHVLDLNDPEDAQRAEAIANGNPP